MVYGRCRLTDPAPGGLGAYDWQINYSDSDEVGREAPITRTPVTDPNARPIRQQGADGPMEIKVSGTILHLNQHQKFIAYRRKSRSNTLVFTDFEGSQYEVIVTSYKAKPVRTLRNPRDSSIGKHYYTYSLTMEVITVISGPWVGEVA